MGKDDALLVTLMIYLTTPEEGGETLFDDANGGKGYHFKPKRGDLAVWWSCDRKGKQVVIIIMSCARLHLMLLL